jgi:SAM-dependent methyltransferase
MAARRVSETALRAALYAAVHRGTAGDLAFYRSACEGARRVLELGCGAGRLAIPLARDGHEVVGVDIDEALLDIARSKIRQTPAALRARLDLRVGDMRALELEELRFDRVLIAHSTIYCLQSDDDVRAMLREVRSYLAPAGQLLIDAYSADGFHDVLDPDADDPLTEIVRVTASGRLWRVLERSDWDREAQRVEAHYRHVPAGGGRAIDTTIIHRYMRAAQLETLLREEGFDDVRIAADFEGTPYGEDAEHMVVTAR